MYTIALILLTAMTTAIPLPASTENSIQIRINHMMLQIDANGNVNGTDYATKNSTLFRRHATANGTLIRSSSNCYFLCMNSCGYVYTSKVPNSECLFVEDFNIDSHYSNLYRLFNDKKKGYVALNKVGKMRRLVVSNNRTVRAGLRETILITIKLWEKHDENVTCIPFNDKRMTKKLHYTPEKKCTDPAATTAATNIDISKKRMAENDLPDKDDFDYTEEYTGKEGATMENFYYIKGQEELHINLFADQMYATTSIITTTTTTEKSKIFNSALEIDIERMLLPPPKPFNYSDEEVMKTKNKNVFFISNEVFLNDKCAMKKVN
ncbi:fibroblast growth factor [Malacosoma neustria nucleopolyhedrovirus]|uniref:fibroblast growth factor n=1 Tax=Malacosoma neustria nuclear polyhedrosis virus TaxID=38012 RepID=UPI000E35F14B|nr:fibroblast growth factor [Malacosoma neustria nucleopolyhedrovirus]AUF81635.1 fibroblast growth factor [Malacosoma neustria nucleopolyhedrovirus]